MKVCSHEIKLGYFVNGLLNGKGEKRILNPNLSLNVYCGDFHDGLKEGNGWEETTEHRYEGDYKADKKSGVGKLIYKLTNDWYEGEFEDNLTNGTGCYTWANGDTFRGTFMNGKMHGKGLYTWPDGGEYYGDYIDNIKEGYGKYRWPNGRIFEGPFRRGKPHGFGKLLVGGKISQVEFVDGKINKNSTSKKSTKMSLPPIDGIVDKLVLDSGIAKDLGSPYKLPKSTKKQKKK